MRIVRITSSPSLSRAHGTQRATLRPLATVALIAIASLARAQTTQSAPEVSIDKVLADLDARAAKVVDLRAKFEQQKITPLLKKPLVSSGTVRAKGSVMLWHTDRPEPTVMRIDGRQLQLLYSNQKVLEVYPIEGRMGAMASNPVPRIDTLREHFHVEATSSTPDTLILRLTPRDQKLKRHVEEVVVEIDLQQALARSFTLTDPDGERTIIRFSDYQVNGGIADELLKLDPPEGTKIVRPLEPGS